MKGGGVWWFLHGLLWSLLLYAATLALVLTFGCYKAWGGEYLTHGYPEGYREDGYVFKGGAFYKGDVPYARDYIEYTKQVPYTYYSYGVPYTGYQNKVYYRWNYYPITLPAPAAAAYAPGWQNRLLDIAANRDKLEGNLRTAALDHQAYVGAVSALGLTGNFRLANYGAAPLYPSYSAPHTPYAAPYAVAPQGNTLYGFSYANVKDLYGDTNLGSLYQQASRLTQNAQTLAGQAQGDFSDLVGKEGGNRARVAEILAQSQAAVAALNAARPAAQTHTEQRTFSFRLEQGANGGQQLVPVDQPAQPDVGGGQQQPGQPGAAPRPLPPPPMPPADARAALAALIESRCTRCHGGAKTEGGFKAASYTQLSPAQKAKVWARLTAQNDKRMPPPEAGPPLNGEEIRLFLTQ